MATAIDDMIQAIYISSRASGQCQIIFRHFWNRAIQYAHTTTGFAGISSWTCTNSSLDCCRMKFVHIILQLVYLSGFKLRRKFPTLRSYHTSYFNFCCPHRHSSRINAFRIFVPLVKATLFFHPDGPKIEN